MPFKRPVVLLVCPLSLLACGGDGSGADAAAPRGEGVPTTWGEYCGEIAQAWCQREEVCDPGFLAPCLEGFMQGCCEDDGSCGSSFGEGVSTDQYETCLDDTHNGDCGALAPDSCVALIGEGPISSDGPPTLAQACAASCQAQEDTNCSGVLTATRCRDLCVRLTEDDPECEPAWIALNACMADAPLMCDSINGGASVSYDDCGAEIDAFAACF